MIRPLVGLILSVGLVAAQTSAEPLRFEVASIKPADPGARGSSILTDGHGSLRVTNTPLRNLIAVAYGIRDFQLLGGPGWIGAERYDIVAKQDRAESKVEPADPRTITDAQRKMDMDQWKERIRSLLADRFGLVVHRTMKEQPIFVLSVAKNGPTLTLAATPGPQQGIRGGRGRTQGMSAEISMLANNLSNNLGRPVVDKTGLTGKYDWVLEWTPDVAAADSPETEAAQTADNPGPTIFTALREQLGLRLEASKGPVEMVVIDRVDRPSAN